MLYISMSFNSFLYSEGVINSLLRNTSEKYAELEKPHSCAISDIDITIIPHSKIN